MQHHGPHGGLSSASDTLMVSTEPPSLSHKNTFTAIGASSSVAIDSSIFTTPNPFNTCPKTTCLPSKCGVGTVVMKNCEPLVFGPALAMLSRPTLSCCMEKEMHYCNSLMMAVQTQTRENRGLELVFIMIQQRLKVLWERHNTIRSHLDYYWRNMLSMWNLSSQNCPEDY